MIKIKSSQVSERPRGDVGGRWLGVGVGDTQGVSGMLLASTSDDSSQSHPSHQRLAVSIDLQRLQVTRAEHHGPSQNKKSANRLSSPRSSDSRYG